jgi:hypothetical protein
MVFSGEMLVALQKAPAGRYGELNNLLRVYLSGRDFCITGVLFPGHFCAQIRVADKKHSSPGKNNRAATGNDSPKCIQFKPRPCCGQGRKAHWP